MTLLKGFSSSSKLVWACSPGGSRLQRKRAEACTASWSPGLGLAHHDFCHMPSIKASHRTSSHLRHEERDPLLGKRSCKVTLPSSLDKVRNLICGHFCQLRDCCDVANITTSCSLTPLPDCIFKQITLNPNRPFHNSGIWYWIWKSPTNMGHSEILMWVCCNRF